MIYTPQFVFVMDFLDHLQQRHLNIWEFDKILKAYDFPLTNQEGRPLCRTCGNYTPQQSRTVKATGLLKLINRWDIFCCEEHSRWLINHCYWNSIKERIKERDNFTCQDCKRTSTVDAYLSRTEPIITNPLFVSDFTVHHILPLEENGTNSYENLITLCQKCHHKRHEKRPRKKVEEKSVEVIAKVVFPSLAHFDIDLQ